MLLISHKNDDIGPSIALLVCEVLRREGIDADIYRGPDPVPPIQAIREQIRTSEALVAILTGSSEAVTSEIQMASDLDIPIFAICDRRYTPGGFIPQIVSWETFDAMNPSSVEHSVTDLLNSLARRGIGPKAKAPSLVESLAIQEAQVKHFVDLCSVAEKWSKQLWIPEPWDLHLYDVRRTSVYYMSFERGLSWELRPDESIVLKLDIEDDILFACLRSHISDSRLWAGFDDWKSSGGDYITSCSRFLLGIRQRAEEQAGLPTASRWPEVGLSRFFPETIYDDCVYRSSGYRGLEDLEYKLEPGAEGILQLWLSAQGLAVGTREQMSRCQEVHRALMQEYRDHEQAQEISKKKQTLSEKMEHIHSELQKIILKRTFRGRCDLCPTV